MNRLCLLFAVLLLASGVFANELFKLGSPAFLTKVQSTYGLEGRGRVEGWFVALDSWSVDETAQELQLLVDVNDYFNQVRWLEDMLHWGQNDYWATPVETLGSNGGDCEDFAIGKYFTLLSLMIDPEQLRIMYVKSIDYNQAHMVLAFYPTPEAEPLILDNIRKTIVPASQRPDLVPIYSFNGRSIWLAKSRVRKLEANSLESLPKWRDLNSRMHEMRKNVVPTKTVMTTQ